MQNWESNNWRENSLSVNNLVTEVCHSDGRSLTDTLGLFCFVFVVGFLVWLFPLFSLPVLVLSRCFMGISATSHVEKIPSFLYAVEVAKGHFQQSG